MNKIKKYIKKNKILKETLYPFYKFFIDIKLYIATKKNISKFKNISEKKIFYFGIPAHSNLGDLAQGVCIRFWIKKHYPEYKVIEIETNAIVNTHFSVLKHLKKIYKEEDIIIFQSGYTTTDLGGFADEMHRLVIKTFPKAKMLMMPQTILFKNKDRELLSSKIYDSAKNMLFLARDKISYDKANKMFPSIAIELYPDIVTTMIGKYKFNNKRNGILFCCRNDDEKYYSDDDINQLINSLKSNYYVEKIDTTKEENKSKILKNPEKYIMQEINYYSQFDVIVTDRYHGTIFSLISGTPVIILKTTDHKVITGIDWFKGVYDDYVYVSKSLNDIQKYINLILKKHIDHQLKPYFEKKYYDKLPTLFESKIKNQ